MICQWYRLTIG
ncbi:hypothetical protein YPPY94_3335, partial [Yersinia pestis PY-94]